MPARDATEEAGPSPLPTILLWAGIGLVPIAAFLLLTGADTGSLQAVMLLVLLVLLLIGGSTGLRGRDSNLRRGMQRALFEEIDQLRSELRTDIGSAVRLTQRSHGDQLQVLQESLAMLRGQLDAVRAELARVASAAEPRPDPPGPDSNVYGAPSYSGTPSYSGVTWSRPVEDAPVTGAAGWAEGSATGWNSTGQAWPEAGRRQSGRYGQSWRPADRSDGDRYAAGGHVPGHQTGDPGPVDGSQPGVHVPGGVVRHTETVRVTTRQTIVGPSGPDPAQTGTHPAPSHQVSGGYGQHVHRGEARPTGPTYHSGTYPVQPEPDHWAAQPAPDRWRQPTAENWAPPVAGHRPEPAVDHRSWQPTEDRAGLAGDHPAARQGADRWASVHADERGQEIRMGQRRASLHEDGSGTRLEVEDRWAALRQEEPTGATSWAELMPSWAEPGQFRAEPEQVRHRYAPGPVDRANPGGRTRMTPSERFDRGR